VTALNPCGRQAATNWKRAEFSALCAPFTNSEWLAAPMALTVPNPWAVGSNPARNQCEKPLNTSGLFSFYVLLRRSKFQ
jgi:hypothetical protein